LLLEDEHLDGFGLVVRGGAITGHWSGGIVPLLAE